jgi:nitrogen-specific signal transduction histidine kinase
VTKQPAKPAESLTNPDINSQRTSEILYGAENAVGRGVQFMGNVKKKMDIFFDHRAPSIVVNIEEYRNGYIDIRRRGAKIRAFTEITKENIQYCKELMKIVDELRHLDGVKGGLAINESEYMATTILEESKPLTMVIYSNVREVVEQGQYLFDTVWRSTISADQKIKEIEEGVIRPETKIIENPDEVIKEIGHLTASSNKLDTCLTSGGLQYSHNYFFEIKKNLLDKQRRGEHKGIRYVTNIDRGNLHISKLYLEHGIQIRHMKNLPPMSFGVSDKQIAVTIEKMEGGERAQSLLISNEPLYVRHFTFLFEEIWRNGIDARHRIKQVEEGVESDIEVIQNPDRTEEIYWNIIKSARKEILLILPTINALIRQEKMGVIKSLAEAAKSRNVQVRILMPKVNLDHRQAIQGSKQPQQVEKNQGNLSELLNVRHLQQLSDTKATVLIADRKVSLVIEVRDDSKPTFCEAIGLSTYSSSKPGILSYVSIFENLWIQTELYEQLKVHDKMQRDFINIAAHELRTPIQPILGLTELVLSRSDDEIQKELLEIVVRNAKRLGTLIDNILDITRIENQSLKLHKERFNINEIISNILEEYKRRSTNKKDDVRILFLPNEDDFFVEADKGRLLQVISNLMNNAIKFTLKGTITVVTKKREENNEIIVSVKDTGSGIDPEIMPRLFSKFATKSQTGTGLGLFVSQNILQAHGGKIWAENNTDGRGSTFSFSLPLTNKKT